MVQFYHDHWLDKWVAQWLVDCERQTVKMPKNLRRLHLYHRLMADHHALVSLILFALSMYDICLIAISIGLMSVFALEIDVVHNYWAHILNCIMLCMECAIKMTMCDEGSLCDRSQGDHKLLNGNFAFKFKMLCIFSIHATHA